jgi:hypothetical protein
MQQAADFLDCLHGPLYRLAKPFNP